MKRRQMKKLNNYSKLEEQINRTCRRLEESYQKLQNNQIRLNYLLGEQTILLSKFPIRVEDWKTRPPQHNGDYIVWFVKGDKIATRLFCFMSGKWFLNGKEIEIHKYFPSCYMPVPILSSAAVEIYRRSEKCQTK